MSTSSMSAWCRTGRCPTPSLSPLGISASSGSPKRPKGAAAMERVARGGGWPLLLGAMILIAWALLAFGGSTFAPPPFCGALAWSTVPPSVLLDLALLLNSPGQLALGWALMVVAMMLPLAIAPIWHVRERSFARRRGRSTALFVAGFVAVWLAAGFIL